MADPSLTRRQWIGGALAAAATPRMAMADDLERRSRAEDNLLIYSNMAEYNWQPIVTVLRRRYPWLRVDTLDMGPTEVFERYYAETSAGRRSADIIVSSAPDAWLRFAGQQQIAPHRSAEDAALPGWSKPLPGLHTLSADPMVMVYNKALLPPQMRPRGLRQLAAIATANPRKFRHRITTYDAEVHALAYAVQWSAISAGRPGSWDLMAKLSPYVRVESGGATMLDKVTVGEYLAGYHISAVTVLPKMRDKGRAEIVSWELCADGTPVVPRGIAVTRKARNPASAALALDFMLGRTGQIAAAQGGLTPYRHDVGEREVPYLTLDGIARRIGGQNLVMVGYDHRMVAQNAAFIRKWDSIFKRFDG